ncbi:MULTISPECIES: hypothetical protein [unclassified Clostridium]|uniref:hypothetical protein n=1 Tax=unclassified Clostridium TaxID=2614128 RepID=UPI000297A8F9|nr:MULTISPECIES: hypothetical protein [unclassified Clostridium]EKQ55908.1 MAG: hypothetical protein A370_02481 [Clostridium sp. Maddingley MBC34-26]
MVEVKLKLDKGTPQYSCNSCSNCKSVFGKSLCSIKNRGCCWYFPKFTLHEIHKMTKNQDGLKTLNNIISLPKVKIYNYYIHAIGYFDEAGYKDYIESKEKYHSRVADKSIFFRACPFVKSGKGCTLPKEYRSYVCNFYICDEIVSEIENHCEYKNYFKERNSYVKWVEWENHSLEILLNERKINLAHNFNEVLNLLENTELREYEFVNLGPIIVADKFNNVVQKLG